MRAWVAVLWVRCGGFVGNRMLDLPESGWWELGDPTTKKVTTCGVNTYSKILVNIH